MPVNAYAALGASEKLVPFSFDNDPIKPHEVTVKVSHCGICHSDIHLLDNDWNMSQYPLVPGHEIVGIVTDKGNQVTHLEIGQRVGIGWQCGSCLECKQCISGDENLCAKNQPTAVAHHGGFANHVRSDSRFAIPIPDSLPSEQAAPLLCGGITVYNPLRNHNIRPDMRVAVVGVGGLGHMALQFYRAYGCEVTAISHTDSKKDDALEFGAHNFVTSKNQELSNLANYFDFILTAANVDLNWTGLLNTLRPKGKLCLVGAASNISVPVNALLFGQKTITTSVIGSPSRIQEMLEFAARQRVLPQTELFKLSEVNDAISKVRENNVRYRAVLDCS